MESDVTIVYERICDKYPVMLRGSRELGFKSPVDFPVLQGHSVLGHFRLFYDGVSFPFYVIQEDGSLHMHWHLQTPEEAEITVAKFMEGTLSLQPFEQRKEP